MCTVYNCLIPDVAQLLSFTYEGDWNLCKDEFTFPETDDGQWPSNRPMKQWLEQDAPIAIKKCARSRSDFSKVVNCVQDSKESLQSYIQRFTTVWDNNAGISRDKNDLFAVQTLVQGLRPYIATAYRLTTHDWCIKGWKDTINILIVVDRNQLFTHKPPHAKAMIHGWAKHQGKAASKLTESTRKGSTRTRGWSDEDLLHMGAVAHRKRRDDRHGQQGGGSARGEEQRDTEADTDSPEGAVVEEELKGAAAAEPEVSAKTETERGRSEEKRSNQPLKAGSASRASSSEIKDRKNTLRSGTQPQSNVSAHKIMIGDMSVCKPWTPSEVMEMTERAPNPIGRPDEYLAWLRQVCSVYNCLVPDVEQLLEFTYGSEWGLCKAEFVFPAAVDSGQWPTTKPLTEWLAREAKTAISKCARNRNDLSKVLHCVQDNKEPLPDFIQRFIETWDCHAGMKREENELFAIQTLLGNLKPHIDSTYGMSVCDWYTKTWPVTVNKLMRLYRNQVCSTGQVDNTNNPQKGGGQHSNRNNNKKRGNCHNCGKPGH